MPLNFHCEQCGKTGLAKDDLAERIVKCPSCANSVVIPGVPIGQPHPTPPPFTEPAVPPTPQVSDLPEIDTTQTTEVAVGRRKFKYRMVQIPRTIVVSARKGKEAARYLEDVVNEYAAEGWEFYRVDEIGVQVNPGCLTIFGRRPPSIVELLRRHVPPTGELSHAKKMACIAARYLRLLLWVLVKRVARRQFI